jgi:hypothetical protein
MTFCPVYIFSLRLMGWLKTGSRSQPDALNTLYNLPVEARKMRLLPDELGQKKFININAIREKNTLHTGGVAGSIPAPPTILIRSFRSLTHFAGIRADRWATDWVTKIDR